MKKKIILLVMCVTCCTMFSACGNNNNNNENTDPLTGQEQTTEIAQDDVPMGENANTGSDNDFDTLLGQENNANGVIDYINTNIVGATENDINRFFTGLLGYGNNIRDIDFTRLDESRQYMPEDMVAFMELMKLETESPSMVMSDEENRMTIGLTLSEMLERALLFEQHIEKYPNSASTEAAANLYEEIATNAITGGYDKTNGVEHYYQGDTADVVDEQALTYYQQFADANPDTRLGQVVQEYIKVLQENQFELNNNVENFYYSIHERLLPAVNDTNTDTAGESNSTANGTTNGAATNGTTMNGTTNGATTNGITNGAATNGATNATTMNGTTNGAETGTNRGVAR